MSEFTWHDDIALGALDEWLRSGKAEHANPTAAFLDGYQARRGEERTAVEAAPDWTLDPLTVAWLRLVATIIIGLRLRQILAWLERRLTRKGDTNA